MLEEEAGQRDFGMRIVTPIACFYDDEEGERYWTDEPVSSDISHEYKRCQHPKFGWQVPSHIKG
jgi:hypothetical protein